MYNIDLSLESYICTNRNQITETGITANFWVYGYSHFLQKCFPPQERSIYYSFDQYN